MRTKRLVVIAAVIAVGTGAYTLWALSDRGLPFTEPDLRVASVQIVGKDYGAGNLISIEPWMLPSDYASERAFDAKLRGYFDIAKQRKWLTDRTIVVLPEYLGTWLAVVNEKKSAYSAPALDQAMSIVIKSNLPPAALSAIASPARDRVRYAALDFKSDQSAAIYDRCLSQIARDYKITLVGGSIVLPSPSVRQGHLRAGRGRLYNVSPVYQPNGFAYPNLSLKCYPVREERPFTANGRVDQLPVFSTPAGKLGVLICADGWFPSPYRVMREEGAHIIASPIFGPQETVMDQPWRGYSGWPAPSDANPGDVGRITERDALFKYGLGGRMPSSAIPYAISSCNGGQLWDETLSTLCTTFVNGKTRVSPEVHGATLVCMWLPKNASLSAPKS